ncbi:MAG TPA: PQQ-binding-like beta-propeller repeat protein, partial [Gemmataceae bacterium]|nr:PQQ-binding-like beta-propeller repeat protein [Gemmataceae bacterium]
MSRQWIAALGCALGLVLPAGQAGEWAQFRGPNGAGLSDEKQLPSEWGKDTNLRWKAKIPGVAWSSPVVWGDRVFVTTASSDKESKPKPGGGLGGMGGFPGGPGGRGRGGFGGPPRSGQLLPSFLQGMLELTADQKKQLETLQKEADSKLGKILTDKQNKQLKDMRSGAGGRGPGGFGGPGGGGFGGPPRPGQILPSSLQERLELTADQKKQLEKLQKQTDGTLAKILTDKQNKQLKDMATAFGRRGPGGRGGPGRGGPGQGGFGRMGGGKPPDAVYRWQVYCLDRATGKVLWKKLAVEKKPSIPKQPANSYASETPVTDGECVYAYFGMTGLYCYDLKGELVWSKDLGSYPMAMGQGTGSSPTLDGDRLFVQCDNEKKSFLVALNKKTGKELWRMDRRAGSSWSTPFVWHNKKRTELVLCGGAGLQSYDPATGKPLWKFEVEGQFQASPVADDEMLYAGNGRMFGPHPLFAIRAGASEDLTLKEGATSSADVAWYRTQAGPAIASPLLYQGYLYVADEQGMLSCYDARTGKPAYTKQRLRGARGTFMASPWAYDGMVFWLDQEGQTFVVNAGSQFKL